MPVAVIAPTRPTTTSSTSSTPASMVQTVLTSPGQSQSVTGPDELAFAPTLEHQAVDRDGGNEQCSGQCRSH